jgi:hypothetical protein
MAFMAELDSGDYGALDGGQEMFPVRTVDHDWETPYPPYSGVAEFAWEPGELGDRPNVFRHTWIRDWVCDDMLWSLLCAHARADVHHIGRGRVGSVPVHVVQVTAMLDIVDPETSIIDRYPSYEILRFPTFVAEAREQVADRIFRVPGSYIDVFVGSNIRKAFDDAKMTGFTYAPVSFVGDDWL